MAFVFEDEEPVAGNFVFEDEAPPTPPDPGALSAFGSALKRAPTATADLLRKLGAKATLAMPVSEDDRLFTVTPEAQATARKVLGEVAATDEQLQSDTAGHPVAAMTGAVLGGVVDPAFWMVPAAPFTRAGAALAQRVAPRAIPRLLKVGSAVPKTVAALRSATEGAGLSGTLQAAENVSEGRPITEGLGTAVATGAGIGGAIHAVPPVLRATGRGMDKASESLYARSLKIPPGSLSENQRAQVINTLRVKEKIPLGPSSMEKIRTRNAVVGDLIDSTFAGLAEDGGKIPVKTVLDRLEALKNDPSFEADLDFQQLNKLVDQTKKKFASHPYAESGFLTHTQAQQMKRNIQGKIDRYYRQRSMPETGRVGIKTQEQAKIYDAAATALRDELINDPDLPPEVVQALSDQRGLMQARKWVERAINRGGNADPISLGGMLFGLLKGNLGTAVAWRLAFSQPIQTRVSIHLGSVGRTLEKLGSMGKVGQVAPRVADIIRSNMKQ